MGVSNCILIIGEHKKTIVSFFNIGSSHRFRQIIECIASEIRRKTATCCPVSIYGKNKINSIRARDSPVAIEATQPNVSLHQGQPHFSPSHFSLSK